MKLIWMNIIFPALGVSSDDTCDYLVGFYVMIWSLTEKFNNRPSLWISNLGLLWVVGQHLHKVINIVIKAHRQVYKMNEYSVPSLIQRMGWIFYHCGNNFILGLWKHGMTFHKHWSKAWVVLSYVPDRDLIRVNENVIVPCTWDQVGTLVEKTYDNDVEQTTLMMVAFEKAPLTQW